MKPHPLRLTLNSPRQAYSARSLADGAIRLRGPDNSIVQAAWDQPYGVENYRVTGYKAETIFPVMFWRSVGASQNAFFHESMIDELAHAKGLDPTANAPRHDDRRAE